MCHLQYSNNIRTCFQSLTWIYALHMCLPQNKVGYPLCSFENNAEYVYDVQWSPVHPAIFASADGEGKLDFWDINVDTEVSTL